MISQTGISGIESQEGEKSRTENVPFGAEFACEFFVVEFEETTLNILLFWKYNMEGNSTIFGESLLIYLVV